MLLHLQHSGWYLMLAPLIFLNTSAIFLPFATIVSSNAVDQPEGVIEYKVAARAVRKQLEDLGIVHRPFLIFDL